MPIYIRANPPKLQVRKQQKSKEGITRKEAYATTQHQRLAMQSRNKKHFLPSGNAEASAKHFVPHSDQILETARLPSQIKNKT